VAVNDFLAYGESNAGTIVLSAAVKTLKHLEDLFGVTLFEADSIVGDRECARAAVCGRCRDGDNARHIFPTVFECVADQVLQQLSHLQSVSLYHWKGLHCNARTCLTLLDAGKPWHPLFNPLVFKAGCS
jgi:hypothetical protein